MVITLIVSDKTHGVLHHNLLNLGVGLVDEGFLLLGDDDVAQVERQTATESLTVTHVLDVVKEDGSDSVATLSEDITDDVTQRLLAHHLIDIAVLVGNNLVKDDTTYGGMQTVGLDIVAVGINDGVTLGIAFHLILGAAMYSHLGRCGAINVGEDLAIFILNDLHEGLVGLDVGIFILTLRQRQLHADTCVEVDTLLVVSDDNLFGRIKALTFTLDSLSGGGTARFGHIVQTQHHILRRNGDRGTIGGVKDVVGGEHQYLCLQDGSIAHGHVHSHLVTIEVGVETGTHQRVQTNGLTFDKFRLEGLDTKTVQRRSTV